MQRPRTLLSDLDGVLIDSEKVLYKAWVELAKRRGEDFTQFDYNRIFGRRDLEVCQIVATHYGWSDDPAMLHRAYVVVLDTLADEIEMRPGAKEALETFKKSNFRMALVTSGSSAHVNRMDRRFGILKYFVALVHGGTRGLKRGKPNPDPYALGAKKLSARPEDCIVLEDSPNGVRAGEAAGCKVVGLAHAHSPASGLIKAGAHIVFPDFSLAVPYVLSST